MPWAERYSRVTLLLDACVVKLRQACPTTQGVCGFTRLAWSTVNDIMPHAVERGMLRRTQDDVPHLGLDEQSAEQGHTTVSILADIDRSRVLDRVPERRLEAAKGLLETLSPTPRTRVKAVAMDRWPAFMSAARACMPQADIVHGDRVHVATYLGDAVDAVRTQAHRSLVRAGGAPLTGSNWAWQKPYAEGRSAEAVAFRTLNQRNLKTSRAGRIKEIFRQFWCYRYTGAAKRFFDAWSCNAMRTRLAPAKQVVRMLRRHEAGLLNYSRHRISNTCAEGFNSAIQLIKANARGFRNFTNYRARILFHCGKLDRRLG